MVLIFFLVNTFLVLLFAGIWHCIQSYSRSCLNNIRTFSDAVLLSVEIHSTIGFGGRSVSGECILNIFTLPLQHFIVCITNGVLLGILMNAISFNIRQQTERYIELGNFHPSTAPPSSNSNV